MGKVITSFLKSAILEYRRESASFFHPPEVRKSKGNCEPGIDIWALGINLYMLATGKKPNNPAYILLRKIDLRLILDSPKGQELSQEHQNLIKDVYGKLLIDTIGKDLLHLICLMLTINPEQRPSAAILLTHPVFLKTKFNLDFIPIRNADQLGIIVNPKKYHVLISPKPGMQITSIPLDMQISLQERLNQQREEIQKEHGDQIDNTVHGLLSHEVPEAFAALQQIYQLSVQFNESQLFFLIEKDIIQSITNAADICLQNLVINNQNADDQENQENQENYLKVRSQYSQMINKFIQIIITNKHGRENVQSYVSTLGLADNLIDFLAPVDEVRIEYLNALNIIIDFLILENVSQFVDKKNILKSLSEVGVQYLRDQPEISNVALNILFEIAKQGIKLGQGFPIFTITVQNFAQLMESVKAGNKVYPQQQKRNNFRKQFENSGAASIITNIFNQTFSLVNNEQLQKEQSADLKDSSSINEQNSTNQQYHLHKSCLLASACLSLFYDNKQKISIDLRVIQILIEEIFPARLEQLLTDAYFTNQEVNPLIQKCIEDANIAIISLEHLLNHTTILNIKDYLRIIENLLKYLNLNEQIPNKYIVNALEIISTIANSTQQMPVFAAVVNVISSPIIENIRSSQIRRYELDIIEKLYTIEIVLAQNGNRFDGIEIPGQQRKISPFLILPQPTEKENIINSQISQSSSYQISQQQSFPSLFTLNPQSLYSSGIKSEIEQKQQIDSQAPLSSQQNSNSQNPQVLYFAEELHNLFVSFIDYLQQPYDFEGWKIKFIGKIKTYKNYCIAQTNGKLFLVQYCDDQIQILINQPIQIFIENSSEFIDDIISYSGDEQQYQFECEILHQPIDMHLFKLIQIKQSQIESSSPSPSNSTTPTQSTSQSPSSSPSPGPQHTPKHSPSPGPFQIFEQKIDSQDIHLPDLIESPQNTQLPNLVISQQEIQLPDLIDSQQHNQLLEQFDIPSAGHSPIISSLQLNQQIQSSSSSQLSQNKNISSQFDLESQSASVETSSDFQHSQINQPFKINWVRSDFQRLQRLGKGGFGSIWLAKEKYTDKLVALKEMDYETQRERDLVDQEIRIHKESYDMLHQSANLQSVPIVEPLGFFLNEDNTKAYQVMEYCERSDLKGYINNMKKTGTEISEDDAWGLISQICSITHKLHSLRIIHGDFKPENILLTKDNQIKLCDFGFVKKINEGEDSVDSREFTMLYVAPETFQNISPETNSHQKLKLTTAADIWTIGVVCYELLAKRHPFMNENDDQVSVMEFVRRVIEDEPAALPDQYSENLKALINRMLIKDPAQRITAFEIHEWPEIQAKLEKK